MNKQQYEAFLRLGAELAAIRVTLGTCISDLVRLSANLNTGGDDDDEACEVCGVQQSPRTLVVYSTDPKIFRECNEIKMRWLCSCCRMERRG